MKKARKTPPYNPDRQDKSATKAEEPKPDAARESKYSQSDMMTAREELRLRLGIALTPMEASTIEQPVPMIQSYTSIGIGPKVAGPFIPEVAADLEQAIVVGVPEKLPKSRLSGRGVPSNVAGIPTDVISCGEGRSQEGRVGMGGRIFVSLNGTDELNCTGTLGAFCFLHGDDRLYILTCAHVLTPSQFFANTNTRVFDLSRREVGQLAFAEPLIAGGLHVDDAAVARSGPDVVSVGPIGTGIDSATPGLPVRKDGAASDVSFGTVRATGVRKAVTYQCRGGTYTFENVIHVRGSNGVFSIGGDSGALVVSQATGNPVGLVFAGSGHDSFVIPISTIMQRFAIRQFAQPSDVQ